MSGQTFVSMNRKHSVAVTNIPSQVCEVVSIYHGSRKDLKEFYFQNQCLKILL
jgi:hypothetical protein